MHEENSNDHVSQSETISVEGLMEYSFQRNPCYNRFMKIICESLEITTETSTTATQNFPLTPDRRDQARSNCKHYPL